MSPTVEMYSSKLAIKFSSSKIPCPPAGIDWGGGFRVASSYVGKVRDDYVQTLRSKGTGWRSLTAGPV